MKVIWSVLCESTVTDRDTNQVSLFNVVDNLAIPVPPANELDDPNGLVPTGSSLVTLWARSNPEIPEVVTGRVVFLGPDNEALFTFEHPVELTEAPTGRGIFVMPGLPLGLQGIYRFKIAAKSPDSDWQELFELPLRVVIQTEDSP